MKRAKPVLLILLIITAAGGLLWWQRENQPMRTIDRRTDFQIRAFQTALSMFEVHCGRYPSESDGLRALISNPGNPGWKGPYLKVRPNEETNVFNDQWGTPFRYVLDMKGPNVISAGPDKKFGTEDDILRGP